MSIRDESGSSSSSSRRPTFTTSLSDFALPPRPTSPSPASVSHLAVFASNAHAAPAVAPALFPARSSHQRGLGGYALRPRSGLSRTLMNANDDNDGDDEDEDSPYGHHHSNLASGRGARESYRSTKDRERDRSERYAASYSRVGSLPPLSPRSMRAGSDGRSYGNRERAISPVSRRDHLLSPEPWTSENAVDDDVEIDLDGLDMKMEDLDEDGMAAPAPEQATSSSTFPVPPPPAPSPAISATSPPSSRPRKHGSFGSVDAQLDAGPSRNQRLPSSGETSNGAVQPLRRVFQLLKDEAKPEESEVASEAKLTKRLSVINEASARLAREGSPFCGPFGAASVATADLGLDGEVTAVSRRRGNTRAHLGGSLDIEHGQEDDDLLDNVGFESEALTSSGEDSDLDVLATTTASILPATQQDQAGHDLINGQQVPDNVDDVQMDGDGDADMAANGSETGAATGYPLAAPIPTALPTFGGPASSRTPPRRPYHPSAPNSANVSPVMDRYGGNSEAPLTPGGAHDLSLNAQSNGMTSRSNTPLESGAPAHNRPTVGIKGTHAGGHGSSANSRKRTGSAWMDFRNSPSATASSGSLEKRHHRLYGHTSRSKRAASAAASEILASARGLSTSPASASNMLNSSGAGGSPRLKNSSAAAANMLSNSRSGLLTKRKYGFASDSPSSDGTGSGHGGAGTGGSSSGNGGGSDRFEPYANSVYKRRAVSPLSTMNLAMFGHPHRGAARSPPLTPGPPIVGLSSTGLPSPSVSAASRRTPSSVCQSPFYPNSSMPSPTITAATPMLYPQHTTSQPQHGYFPIIGGAGAGSGGSGGGNGGSGVSNGNPSTVTGGGSPSLLAAVAPRTVGGAANRPVSITPTPSQMPSSASSSSSRSGSSTGNKLLSSGSRHPSSHSRTSSRSGVGIFTPSQGPIPSFGEGGSGLGPSLAETVHQQQQQRHAQMQGEHSTDDVVGLGFDASYGQSDNTRTGQ